MLVDLRPKKSDRQGAEASLERAAITCNKNGIPFDPEKPTVTSGVRLGSPAGTDARLRQGGIPPHRRADRRSARRSGRAITTRTSKSVEAGRLPNCATASRSTGGERRPSGRAAKVGLKKCGARFVATKIPRCATRPTEDNAAIRRRRSCPHCGSRFTTFERVQLRDLVVVKKKASAFPSIATSWPARLAWRSESAQSARSGSSSLSAASCARSKTATRPRSARRMWGSLVMEELKALDGVAYIRYASVYRDFREAKDFQRVLGELGDAFPAPPKKHKCNRAACILAHPPSLSPHGRGDDVARSERHSGVPSPIGRRTG